MVETKRRGRKSQARGPLAALRRKRGMTQRQLADRAKISQSNYVYFEYRRRAPDIMAAARILLALGISPSSITLQDALRCFGRDRRA